ncbi:MAG: mechanosensitive ion channel family protein [Proteobacteria bacterium]|nr:mechanosensitive ion channel family protein [Pseudomonadota bacterium]MBU1639035.1 mechanosensitive ion channel family protein [Pseudomonadota bacterium]
MNIFWQNILLQLQGIFNPAATSTLLAQVLTKVIVGAIILLIFYLGWLVVQMALRILLKQLRTNEMTSTFLLTLVKYSLLIIGLVTALDTAGIKISAVLASLGIAGLTIGFAARDSLSNIIAGVLIFLDRPFVIGDLVEIDSYYGRVDKITLRSTRIVTVDGKMLAVPNTEIINKTVASYTNFPHLRVDIPVTIAVTEDIDKARLVLLSLVEDKEKYLDNPPPTVVVRELNDYNIKLELRAWIIDERKHIEYRFGLREKMFKALTQAGIEMPFETLSINPLHIQTMN